MNDKAIKYDLDDQLEILFDILENKKREKTKLEVVNAIVEILQDDLVACNCCGLMNKPYKQLQCEHCDLVQCSMGDKIHPYMEHCKESCGTRVLLCSKCEVYHYAHVHPLSSEEE